MLKAMFNCWSYSHEHERVNLSCTSYDHINNVQESGSSGYTISIVAWPTAVRLRSRLISKYVIAMTKDRR